MKDISKILVNEDTPIRKAVETMDAIGVGFIACIDTLHIVKGILTDGDFRRAMLNGAKLDEKISTIYNTQYSYLKPDYSTDDIDRLFINKPIKHIPVISEGKLADIILFDNYNKHRKLIPQESLKNPVVIMAGGKGSRLEPFTKVLPKPLLPIGDKTILEKIIEQFQKFGINDFHLSLNYKKDLIKAYFNDKILNYSLSFMEEDVPLGTIGSLYLLKEKLTSTFFVTNCDILIDEDYASIYNFHKENNNKLTIVSSIENHTIPYGVCEIDTYGKLKKINEKPQMDYFVNTGFYLLEPAVLSLIDNNKRLDFPDLISIMLEKKWEIGIYPISTSAWIDIGQMESYSKHLLAV